MYGDMLPRREILHGGVAVPEAAQRLLHELAEYPARLEIGGPPLRASFATAGAAKAPAVPTWGRPALRGWRRCVRELSDVVAGASAPPRQHRCLLRECGFAGQKVRPPRVSRTFSLAPGLHCTG